MNISLKSLQEQSGVLPIVKRYFVVLCTFLHCNKKIPPLTRYGMGVTWLMRASRMAADSQWFLFFTDTLPSGRRHMWRPLQRVGYASGASGVGTEPTSAMSLLECPKRCIGEISWCSSNWNLAYSSLRISPFVNFVPLSTGQTFGDQADHPLLVGSLHTTFDIVHTMEELHHLVLQLMANVQESSIGRGKSNLS